MLDWLFLGLCRGYNRIIVMVERLISGRIAEESPPETESQEGDFETLDAQATRAATLYRGVGIAIALLGLAVIIIELLASNFTSNSNGLAVLVALKFLIMASILFLAFWAIRVDLRGKFIGLRHSAERERFKVLINHLNSPELTSDQISSIEALIRSQRDYQERRASQYRAMTWLTNRLTWVLFAFALAATAFETVARLLALEILATAQSIGTLVNIALAVLATVQSINAFLRLESRRHEARRVAEILKSQLEVDAAWRANRVALKELHKELTSREDEWVTASNRGGEFKPGS